MELSRGKRWLLGLSLIFIVVGCFFSGFMLGKVKPSRTVYTSELNEVVSYLDKYYYKDFDMDEFTKKYVEAGVSSLNDPYTYIYYSEDKKDGDYVGYGFGVSKTEKGLRITTVYDESPAGAAGIKRDDYIVGVDDLIFGKKKLDEIDDYIKSKDTEITLHLLRSYKEFDIKIKKGNVKQNKLVESTKLGEIGYMKINQFDSGCANSFKTELAKLEEAGISGLIIDVRNNPGGLSNEVAEILKIFLTGSDAFLYLDSKAYKTPEVYRPISNNVKKSYDIKVLINENSASASEVFALAMNRVMNYDLIGKKTFGKGVFQSDIELTSIKNAYLHVTLGYWYGKDKECIDKEGIDPTIEVDNEVYSALPASSKTYNIDMASDDIKNVELMLKALGYEVRTDGYFDSNLEIVLSTNYSTTTLDEATQKQIFDEYSEFIKDYNNDKVIQKAITLFE